VIISDPQNPASLPIFMENPALKESSICSCE